MIKDPISSVVGGEVEGEKKRRWVWCFCFVFVFGIGIGIVGNQFDRGALIDGTYRWRG